MSSAPEKTEDRGVDLSFTQVVAGALAAVSSAVAASYFGVAGTLLGAALGSVVATVGTAIYKASLARTKDKLQEIVPIQTVVLRPLGNGHRHDAGHADDPSPPQRTEAVTVAGGIEAPGHPASVTGDLAPTPTGLPGAAAQPAAAGTGRPRHRWGRLAAVAVATFAVSIGAVGAVEAAAGQSLTSLLPGGDKAKRDDTVFPFVSPRQGGGAATPTPGPTPTVSPTATPSRSAPSGSPSPSASPSAAPRSASPVPSGPSVPLPTRSLVPNQPGQVAPS